jgi:hypothetical protein
MGKDTFIVAVSSLEQLEQLEDFSPQLRKAARIAVNFAATKGRTILAKAVLEEIALPRSYVQPGGKRLYIKNKATDTDLTATVFARTRRTSLTRFIPGGFSPGKNNGSALRVKVGANKAVKKFEGAFIFKLRGANGSTDPDPNYGFAVRTKNGKPPPNAYAPTQVGKNLWLLYGPSVAQILYSERNKGGLATENSPKLASLMEAEFRRQMGLT